MWLLKTTAIRAKIDDTETCDRREWQPQGDLGLPVDCPTSSPVAELGRSRKDRIAMVERDETENKNQEMLHRDTGGHFYSVKPDILIKLRHAIRKSVKPPSQTLAEKGLDRGAARYPLVS